MTKKSHFEGQSPLEHLKSARMKGAVACGQHPGLDIPSHFVSMFDSIRDLCLINYLLYLTLMHFPLAQLAIYQVLLFFSMGFILYKVARQTHKEYAKLERLNHLMEQERYEIKHNSEEERRELTEIYAAKGFSGPLLEKVIDTLMADDNKLLHVMLEEEMGLRLQSIDHPLKTTLFTLLGTLVTTILLLLSSYFLHFPGILTASYAILAISSGWVAHLHNNNILHAIVWNLSILFVSTTATVFFLRFILS